MTVEEKAYNYASKVVKNRLTASEVAAHYGRGYIDGQEDMKQLGWHPSSEHPPVDKETGFSELVVGIMPGDTVGFPQYVRYQKNEFYDRWIYGYTGVPSAINIKWWCYPPKED